MFNAIRMTALLVLASILGGCTGALIVGGATGISMAHDRRTAGTYVEDQNIELKAMNELAKDKNISSKAHVSVTSYNRIVLLSGEVLDDAMRTRAVELVRRVSNIRKIHNELVIAKPSTLSRRSKDTWITTKIKTKLFNIKRKNFDPSRVKVVTERGTVYLMGLVTREEAADVVELVRKVAGVRKVVKVFEYTN
jgi:osmotically-inducible protein OsmY